MLRQLRAALHSRERRSCHLRAELAEVLGDAPPLRIAIYAPLPHEVNLLPLLEEYPQHLYAFPRCEPETRMMEFYEIRDVAAQLQLGAHGILEPIASAALIVPHSLDIIIVPGVAFTPEGKRLGYGGGYYDRYLARATQARVIALAFAEQVVDELPTEQHDVIVERLYLADDSTP